MSQNLHVQWMERCFTQVSSQEGPKIQLWWVQSVLSLHLPILQGQPERSCLAQGHALFVGLDPVTMWERVWRSGSSGLRGKVCKLHLENLTPKKAGTPSRLWGQTEETSTGQKWDHLSINKNNNSNNSNRSNTLKIHELMEILKESHKTSLVTFVKCWETSELF